MKSLRQQRDRRGEMRKCLGKNHPVTGSDFWVVGSPLNQSGAESKEAQVECCKKKRGGVRSLPPTPQTVPHTCNCAVIYVLSDILCDNTCCH